MKHTATYGLTEEVSQVMTFDLKGLNPILSSDESLRLQIAALNLPVALLNYEAVQYIEQHTTVTVREIEDMADKMMDDIQVLILARMLQSRKVYD
jgi:hypothetical protein